MSGFESIFGHWGKKCFRVLTRIFGQKIVPSSVKGIVWKISCQYFENWKCSYLVRSCRRFGYFGSYTFSKHLFSFHNENNHPCIFIIFMKINLIFNQPHTEEQHVFSTSPYFIHNTKWKCTRKGCCDQTVLAVSYTNKNCIESKTP